MKNSMLAAAALAVAGVLLNGCTGKPDAAAAPESTEVAPSPAADAHDAAAASAAAHGREGHDTERSAGPVVEDAWIRLPPAAAPVVGGYLTLRNPGAQDDRLLAVRSPAAERVEIHEMRMDGDMMQMRELSDGLQLPAGQTVSLEPGGTHLMFMQPRTGLSVGDEVEAVLVFEAAGEQAVRFQVRDERGRGEAHEDAGVHESAHRGH